MASASVNPLRGSFRLYPVICTLNTSLTRKRVPIQAPTTTNTTAPITSNVSSAASTPPDDMPLEIDRTIMPRMSSTTAAPTMAFEICPPMRPRSDITLAVTATLVATSVAPMKTASMS